MGGVGAVVDVVESSGRTIQPLLPASRHALAESEESLALLLLLPQLPVLHLRGREEEMKGGEEEEGEGSTSVLVLNINQLLGQLTLTY